LALTIAYNRLQSVIYQMGWQRSYVVITIKKNTIYFPILPITNIKYCLQFGYVIVEFVYKKKILNLKGSVHAKNNI
jgi:hypothetical protein